MSHRQRLKTGRTAEKAVTGERLHYSKLGKLGFILGLLCCRAYSKFTCNQVVQPVDVQ